MGNNEKDKILKYMINNKIYPIYSKKDRIYFMNKKNLIISDEKLNEIIEKLDLKNSEDCNKIRILVKEENAKQNNYQSIKNWVKEEQPREMLIKNGPSKLSQAKLLAIILRTGTEGISAEELSRNILTHFKSLRGIDTASISELCEIQGIGKAKATQIKAVFELGKRLYREKAAKKKRISTVDDVIIYVSDYYSLYLRDSKKEFFNIILLDSRNKVIKNIELSKGSSTSSVVETKEIIMKTTVNGASSIILVHNHPSGEPEPSIDDIETTNKIVKACDLVGIKVVDHIIIGKNREDYVSFLEKGLIR